MGVYHDLNAPVDCRYGLPGYPVVWHHAVDCLDSNDGCYSENWLHAGRWKISCV